MHIQALIENTVEAGARVRDGGMVLGVFGNVTGLSKMGIRLSRQC